MYYRAWNRWLQWREANLDSSYEDRPTTAAEVAVYLTYFAHKSGGIAAVKKARTALTYYAGLPGIKGSFMKDELIVSVVKGLERDFAKPIQQREGFNPE